MMSQMPQNIQIIGAKGKIESVEDFLLKAHTFISDHDSKGETLLQFMKADKVLGKEHIISAIEHADRAFTRGKNISTTRSMEILVYAAGEPQIKNALAKVGLKDGCERIAIIIAEGLEVESLLNHLALERDDSVLECDESKLRGFGISEVEISAVENTKLRDLVLERVAMVDVKK